MWFDAQLDQKSWTVSIQPIPRRIYAMMSGSIFFLVALTSARCGVNFKLFSAIWIIFSWPLLVNEVGEKQPKYIRPNL